MFRRKAKAENTGVEEQAEVAEIDAKEAEELTDQEAESTVAETKDKWEQLQASQDWREDGPFDFEEVDLSDDPVERANFGSMILTASDGIEVQLQVMPGTLEAPAALLIKGDSAMELALFAAPSTPGFVNEVRRDIVAGAKAEGGIAEVHEGPFGPEIRRVVRVKDENGKEMAHQSRVWLIEGPRWMLRASLMGKASMDEKLSGPAKPFVEFLKNIIVCRGEKPRPAGEILPMTIPEGMMQAPQQN